MKRQRLGVTAATICILVVVAVPVDVFPELLPVILFVLAFSTLLWRRELRGFPKYLGALGLWALCSVSWSVAPGWSVDALVVVGLAGGLFLLASNLAIPSVLVGGLALVALFHGCLALWQACIGLPQLVADLDGLLDSASVIARQRAAVGRAFSTFALPGQLGAVMAALVPLFVDEVARGRGARRSVALMGLIGVSSAILCSRALGAVVGLALVAAVSAWSGGRRSRASWVLVTIVAVLLVAVGVERKRDLFDPGAQSNPILARARHLERALGVMATAPISGWGVGAYPIASLAFAHRGDVPSGHAHASYAEFASDLGVPCLLLLFLFIADTLRHARDSRFQMAACVLLVHALWDLDLQSGLLPITFAFLGLSTRARTPFVGVGSRALSVMTLVVCALVAHQSQAARTMVLRAGQQSDDGRLELLTRAVRDWPLDARAHGSLATELHHRGRLDLALKVARTAGRLEPITPWIAALQGEVLIAKGDGLGAYLAYHAAERRMPSWAPYRERREALEPFLAPDEVATH